MPHLSARGSLSRNRDWRPRHRACGRSAGSGRVRLCARRASGTYTQFPQQGTLVIEDDVEIGANTTIDRGALAETRIRRGTKIDNLVHVGHNCDIGEDVILVALTGISGSSTIGNGAILAGQVGIGDHVKVGPGVMLGGQAGVLSGKTVTNEGLAPGTVLWGTPARPLKQVSARAGNADSPGASRLAQQEHRNRQRGIPRWVPMPLIVVGGSGPRGGQDSAGLRTHLRIPQFRWTVVKIRATCTASPNPLGKKCRAGQGTDTAALSCCGSATRPVGHRTRRRISATQRCKPQSPTRSKCHLRNRTGSSLIGSPTCASPYSAG